MAAGMRSTTFQPCSCFSALLGAPHLAPSDGDSMLDERDDIWRLCRQRLAPSRAHNLGKGTMLPWPVSPTWVTCLVFHPSPVWPALPPGHALAKEKEETQPSRVFSICLFEAERISQICRDDSCPSLSLSSPPSSSPSPLFLFLPFSPFPSLSSSPLPFSFLYLLSFK